MAWEHLSINKPHLVYIILGGFTSIFMLCSLFIKEKLYIGEATVATIVGVIFGPHAANLIDPFSWGNEDQITLEFSRIVLVVQCFAVGVELPKSYMERHWKSVVLLLLPVMTWGWLATSLFIWWMIEPLTWLESLACAACVTATDPVLASSVVGKGKFAKRVPKHLRDVLSAESGCNDGMAFPFIYLSIYLLRYRPHAGEVAFHWFCYTILYECIFGGFYGFMVGYIARFAIRWAEKKQLIDRESFLVFYFVLALFCAGSGSMLGMDDLLIGFSAGVGFSNDGWFSEKTEESHVSNVIDLLLNLTYFVYLGTIVPWETFNAPEHGMQPWRLVVISLFVIFFRRIPIMLMMKPIIPDVKTWREALFAGHFGPIGVGAVFAAILARAELETESTDPLAELPPPGSKEYELIYLIWPITIFLVISSILVHGSSIAVFTLGKRINTLTITLSYTKDLEDGPGWMSRLPRMGATSSKSSGRYDTSSAESMEKMDFPPGTLPPTGYKGSFLQRQKEDETGENGPLPSNFPRPVRKKKKFKGGERLGGPISDSAFGPSRHHSGAGMDEKQEGAPPAYNGEKGSSSTSPERDWEDEPGGPKSAPAKTADVEAYEEGHELIIEDEEGTVLETKNVRGMSAPEKASIIDATRRRLAEETSGEHAKHKHQSHAAPTEGEKIEKDVEQQVTADGKPYEGYKKQFDKWSGWGAVKQMRDGMKGDGSEKPKSEQPARKRGPAHAYQFGNTIIIEDEDGEVIKKITLPTEHHKPGTERKQSNAGEMRRGLERMGTWVGVKSKDVDASPQAAAAATATANVEGESTKKKTKKDESDNESDDGLRFTISRTDRYGPAGHIEEIGHDSRPMMSQGRRMSTKDFLAQFQGMSPEAKADEASKSTAPQQLKDAIFADARIAKDERHRQGRTRSTSGLKRPTIDTRDSSSQLPGPGEGESTRRPTDRRTESQAGYFSPVKEESEPESPTMSRQQSSVDKRPQPKRTTTADSTASQEIPIHDVHTSVFRHGKGSAADARRARLESATTQPDDETQGETAAEKRRRLAALGMTSVGEDSSSEEEDIAATFKKIKSQEGEEEIEIAGMHLPLNHMREEREEMIPEEELTKPRVQWGGESGRVRDPALEGQPKSIDRINSGGSTGSGGSGSTGRRRFKGIHIGKKPKKEKKHVEVPADGGEASGHKEE